MTKTPPDNIAAYFLQLSKHDLLTPDQERELSQCIEDTEIMTWEHVLTAHDPKEVINVVNENLDKRISVTKLVKAKPGKTKGKHCQAVARQIRAVDLDRVLVDKVISTFQVPPEVKHSYKAAADLRNEFVRANLRLVVTMARRYDRGGMPLADLIQEGNLGLMHAVSRFDYRRGLRFSTYACWWIRHAIGRALADKARAVRIPVHMIEAQQHIDKVRQVLIGELGRQPTAPELAKASGVPLVKLNQMHRYILGQSMSLDRPIHDDDDRNFGDTIPDPSTEEDVPGNALTLQVLFDKMHGAMKELSQVEVEVLSSRFGLGNDEERTFREIGEDYNLSRERIRQIQNNALVKLKKLIEKEHKGPVEL